MIGARKAHEMSEKLGEVLGDPEVEDFLVLVPFETGPNGGVSFISACSAEGPHAQTLMASATLKTLVTSMMQNNGLTPSASAGALHAILDEVVEEIVEEIQDAHRRLGAGAGEA